MDKGIRPACNAKFLELLPTRAEIGNTAFRKNVMFHVIEQFGITLASAATHYNHAFQECKKANPTLVEGLGRADDKKGGRKPKVAAIPELVGPVAPTETAADPLLLGYTAPVGGEVGDAGETGEVQTVFTVKKKGDDTVIGTFSFEDATALVAKAKAAKKAALYLV